MFLKAGRNMLKALPVIMYYVIYLTTILSYTSAEQTDLSVSTINIASQPFIKHGISYASEKLVQKLDEEEKTWHWKPWMATKVHLVDDIVTEVTCIVSSNTDSFPDGWLTDEQLRRGGLIIYVLGGIYAFTLLALVCNDYFIPCVELICEDLNIPENVAAATFMSIATSSPEFFVNLVSTFILESDLGLGTIVGSALFNALGVAAIGGLAAIHPIKLDPWPVTRDSMVYLVNVSVLVAIVWDGVIQWVEATVLVCLYVLYFFFIFNSLRLYNHTGKTVKNLKQKYNKKYSFEQDERKVSSNLAVIITNIEDNVKQNDIVNSKNERNFSSNLPAIIYTIGESDKQNEHSNYNHYEESKIEDHEEKLPSKHQEDENSRNDEENKKSGNSLWRYPKDKRVSLRFWWVYTWPLKLLLTITIPSPQTFRKIYPLSFILCIVWIGVNSYFVSWFITVIGETLFIPDTVMGMTFLAFGGCLPEACSIFIMSRKGNGALGVSNALGANSLAILFALGVPWFIKCMVSLASGNDGTIEIGSGGINYIIASLLLAVVTLWVLLKIRHFTLRKVTGAVIGFGYVVFIIYAILVEYGIFFNVSLPQC